MVQTLKQKPLGYWLSQILLAVPFVYMILVTELGFSFATIHRFTCIVSFILLVLVLKDRRRLLEHCPQVKWLVLSVGLFFLSTLAGQLRNFHPLYYLSGLNNSIPYFAFFFACILYVPKESCNGLFRILDGLFWLNFVVSMYQLLVLGLKWDYLGGIFGVTIGCSSCSNNLLTLVVTISVVRYLNHQEKGWVCLLKCATSLLIAALAELKMFMLMFAAIVILGVLMTKFSRQKLYLLIGGAIGVFLAAQLLFFIFPGWRSFFTLDKIIQYSTNESGYMGIGDYNRLTAIPRVWTDFLNSGYLKVFGLGMGNCDYGFTDALTPAFYFDNYNLHYMLFTSCFILMETGLVGILLYMAFYPLVFLLAHYLERNGKANPVFCQISKIMVLYSLVLFLYDSSLRTEDTYLIFFSLVLPFLGTVKNAKQ